MLKNEAERSRLTAPKQKETSPPSPWDIPGVVGWNIRQHRISRKLTQEKLAEKVGVSVDTIKRYESGTYEGMQLVMVCHIAEALGSSPHALLPPMKDCSPEQSLETAEALIRSVRERYTTK